MTKITNVEYSIIHSFYHSKLDNQGALVTIKCSKRISRWGRRNDNFWEIWVFFWGLKNENTWGVKIKSFAKSITTGAETCMTESSETEHCLDSLGCPDCSVFACWIACTRICEAENVLPKTVNINISDIIKTLNKRAMWDDFCILNDKSSTFLSVMPNSVPKFWWYVSLNCLILRWEFFRIVEFNSKIAISFVIYQK